MYFLFFLEAYTHYRICFAILSVYFPTFIGEPRANVGVDLTSFIRLVAEWGREVLIAPSGFARVLALNMDRTAGVEYVIEGGLEGR